MGIKDKVIHGVKWMFFLRILTQLGSLFSKIVVTRFISPEAYGIFTIAILVEILFVTLSEFGLKQSIIQRKDIDDGHLNTAWTFEIVKGIFVSFLVFIFANKTALFYNNPTSNSIIKFLALNPLILSLINIRVVFFSKELNFKKYFYLDGIAILINITLTIILAFWLKNEWALAVGIVSANLAKVIISYFYYPNAPKFYFSRLKFMDLFGFGKWILIGGIFHFLSLEGDKLIIGKLLTLSTLGLYQMAQILPNIISREFKEVLGKVLFPSFSKLQSDSKSYNQYAIEAYAINLHILLPMLIGMFIVANDLSIIVFSAEWKGVGNILAILSLAAAVRALIISSTGVFFARNKPNIPLYFTILRFSIFIVLVWFLTKKYNIYGVAYSLIVANSVTAIYLMYMYKKYFLISYLDFIRKNVITAVGIIIMMVISNQLKYMIDNLYLRFCMILFVSTISYILSSILISIRYKDNPVYKFYFKILKLENLYEKLSISKNL